MLIFKWRVVQQASVWQRCLRELGNGLISVFPNHRSQNCLSYFYRSTRIKWNLTFVFAFFNFLQISFLTRELNKQVTGCSGGSAYANKWLVDYLLTFGLSAVLRAHISIDISRTTRYVTASFELKVELLAQKNWNYSLSRNTRENFWNVYCFVTNQMRDITAKDNGQTQHG